MLSTAASFSSGFLAADREANILSNSPRELKIEINSLRTKIALVAASELEFWNMVMNYLMIVLVLRSRDQRWSWWSSLHHTGKGDSLGYFFFCREIPSRNSCGLAWRRPRFRELWASSPCG
ncbi:hypothetical protein CEXT_340541 [Caerostris extrusa]|uniref:Uncharacterized protein n=1 Tax=Caerostris extrusa TaxID=172846 RepID=A0AAV4N1M5_CAEEX|nr:hypothetical protein CEXT_340541 [Caerostris extrusa]